MRAWASARWLGFAGSVMVTLLVVAALATAALLAGAGSTLLTPEPDAAQRVAGDAGRAGDSSDRAFDPDDRTFSYWSPERMDQADGDGTGGGTGRPLDEHPPAPREARAIRRYEGTLPETVVGRLFFVDDQNHSGSCSATVVDSPGRNMGWTAGHCLHSGRGGAWFRDLIFIPAYNTRGLPGHQHGYAPYGTWAVEYASTSNVWIANGARLENTAYSWDYGAFTVAPDRQGRRLQDVVGAGVPLLFNPPRDLEVSSYGFPADQPFNGYTLFRCDSPTSSYRPRGLVNGRQLRGSPMLWIGCTMTGGSSGGGWFARMGQHTYLVSNTSMGWHEAGVQAGPYLDQDAKEIFDQLVRRSD